MLLSNNQILLLSIFFNFSKIKCQIKESNERSDLSSREIEILKKFKVVTKDILYLDYQRSDAYLLTWLRASELDLEKAKNRLEKALQWRKEKSIDSLIDNPEMKKLKKKFLFDATAYDKHGHAVLDAMVGRSDYRSIALAGKTTEHRLYYNYMYEVALNRTRENGLRLKKDLSGMLMIMNVAGFNLRQHACLACFPLISGIAVDLDTYYGGFAHSLVVLNAPKAYEVIVDFVRRLLSPSARDSLTVLSHDKAEIKAFLSTLIDDDQLAVAYGGKRIVKF